MMNHRTLPLAMVLALTLAQGAFAAGSTATPRGPQMDAGRMTERMSERLELAPEQSSSVLRINERFVADMQKQNAKMRKAREEHGTAVRKLMEERDAQLKKVLTEEQYSKYSEQRSKARGNWRKGYR